MNDEAAFNAYLQEQMSDPEFAEGFGRRLLESRYNVLEDAVMAAITLLREDDPGTEARDIVNVLERGLYFRAAEAMRQRALPPSPAGVGKSADAVADVETHVPDGGSDAPGAPVGEEGSHDAPWSINDKSYRTFAMIQAEALADCDSRRIARWCEDAMDALNASPEVVHVSAHTADGTHNGPQR